MKKYYYFLLLLSVNLMMFAEVHAQQRPDIWTFDANERYDLRQLMMTYITTPVVNQHLLPDPVIGNFHNYREEFLYWHRDYIADMEAFLLTQPGGDRFVPLPKWDPVTVIPDEFFNALVPPGNAVAPGWSFSTITNQDPVNVDFSPILNNLCSYTPSPGRTAIDNFAQALESRHDPVHGNIGGIMGSFQSPAAAIFWLWHAWVDDVYRQYECDCQGIDANDLYTKDSVEDVGKEANDETVGALYQSTDIWVRNAPDVTLPNGRYSQEDNPLRHQNPEYSSLGNPNFVYVKIRNRGCNTIPAGTADLRVYWSKASTGLNWPTHFVNYFSSGILHGDEITAGAPVSIPALPPGGSFVAEIPWVAPNPADFTFDAQHFCLLSRIESPADPMTFVEVPAVAANTRNNNNISWKNLTVVDIDPLNLAGGGVREEVVFFVRQTFDSNQPLDIVFKAADPALVNGLTIQLDDNLRDLAVESQAFRGLEVVDGPGELTTLRLTGRAEAKLERVPLEPGEIYAIRLNFEFDCSDRDLCPTYGDVKTLAVEQYLPNDFGGNEFIGGNLYEVRIKQDEETKCGDFPIVNVSVDDASCSNTPDGLIKLALEGAEPFDIFWEGGQDLPTLEELLPGEYTVSVRDARNCVNTRKITLSDRSDLKLIFEPTHVTRFCNTLGSIQLAVEGGDPEYSVRWSNGSDDFRLERLETGMYVATVTDGSGCQIIDSVSINQHFPLRINASEIQDESSSGANDGALRIAVTGGEQPLNYSWSNGANSNALTGLSVGEYVVTITDKLSCQLVDTFTVDLASGVSANVDLESLAVYPIPSSNEVIVDFSLMGVRAAEARIQVINAKGQVQEDLLISSATNKHKLNIEAYPPGIYLVRFYVDNAIYVRKFIRQ